MRVNASINVHVNQLYQIILQGIDKISQNFP